MNVRSVNVPRRGRPLVDDKRRIVLDAALRVFAERGYHGASIPEVAAAAAVGTGTLYRYFESKEALVNQVFRDAKLRLRAALLDGETPAAGTEPWFRALWNRMAAFAEREPDAFGFLEMQDHVPYLDAESRQVELSLLGPLYLGGTKLQRKGGPAVDVMIALLWGAFVGLVKAARLGYLKLDARALADAADACWRMIKA